MKPLLARALTATAACALLAGCVQMPTDGPVREPQVSVPTDDVPGISFNPRPPRAGEAPVDIVENFLEAMKATPISLTVARLFLSEETVKSHVRHLLAKLQARSRAHAVAVGFRRGIIG